jgi:hypothetical protein
MSRRFKEKVRKPGPVPTFLCRNRKELTLALAAVRDHLGISQIELDAIAGFPDGYTGKIECPAAPGRPGSRPSGRSVFPASLDLWLAALGAELVVTVPGAGRTDISTARPPRVVPPRMAVKRAEKIRVLHNGGKGRSRETLWRMFQITPQMVDDIIAGRAYVPARSA